MLQPVTRGRPRIELTAADPNRLPGVVADWERLAAASPSLYALYQSPQWFEHLRQTEAAEGLLLAVARDGAGQIAGVAPVQLGRHDLLFEAKTRLLWKSPLRAAVVLGSQPLLPPDDGLHDEFFRGLDEHLPGCDGVYLHSVPTDGYLWEYLHRSPAVRRQFLVHLPSEVRPFHALELPERYEDYLARFGKKKRYNLKRQVRLLHEHAGLALERVEAPDQVADFAAAVIDVAHKSWQPDATDLVADAAGFRRKLDDLAGRGLLRAYLLRCAGRPGAYVLGYQYRGVYHYANVGYDQALREFSPGAVLLWLLLQDLFGHRPPRHVNFGIGHSRYKEEFGNVHAADASVLLLRKTAANRLRRGCHATYRSLRGLARRVLRRRPPRPEERAEPPCQTAPGLPS
jgi:CelD/BcsL family acetyltransferase involved in cellulose biosynthesis